MVNFRRGAEAAEESAAKGSSQRGLQYFSIKKEEPVKVLRFLTDMDDLITTTMHPSMPTRPAPPDYKGNWPATMGAVCRMDEYKGERIFPEYADCFHCLNPLPDGKGGFKPRAKNTRTWGLAVVRREIPAVNAQGHKVIAFEDSTREFEVVNDKGITEKMVEPEIVVVQQAWSNFWTMLNDEYKMRGTILDRDWRVTRKGFTMNDTDYGIVGYDPVYVNTKEGVEMLDLREPKFKENYGDLGKFEALADFVANLASDEFYDRFFDIRHPQPINDKAGGDATSAATANVVTPATELPQANIQAIADRLAGIPGVQAPQPYGAQAAQAAPVVVPTAPTAPQPQG